MNKTIDEYFETHTEPVELAFGTFYSAADGNVRLVMRDGSEITAFDEEDLQDFYEDIQLESFVSAPYADPQWMPDTCAKAAIFMPAQIPVCIRIWTSVMELESGNRPLHLQQKRKK